MRYHYFVSFCALFFTAVILLYLSASRFSVMHHSDEIRNYEYKEVQYLRQIKSLEDALKKIKSTLVDERKLTADLQSELRDTHDYVRDIFINLQKTNSKFTTSLGIAYLQPGVQAPAVSNLTNIDSVANLDKNYEDLETRSSLYAPSNKSLVQKKERRVSSLKLTETEDLNSLTSGLFGHQSRKRTSNETINITKLSSAENNSAVRKLTSSSKAKSSLKRKTFATTKTRMRLGYARKARTRVLNKHSHKKRLVRRRILFNHLARQGVFGEGYHTQ